MEAATGLVGYWISNYAVKILIALLILLIGKWISHRISILLGKLLEKNRIDLILVKFLENITYYTLLIMVLIAAAGQLGIPTTSFLTVLGAAGLAIGLALKSSLSNFASGVMLILFRPFTVGDFITAGGASGTVNSVNIFNTVLTTPDNQKVIVPNNSITNGNITNVTANPTRRINLVVGIGYGDDILKAKEVLMDLMKSEPRVLSEPAPSVAVSELADSSVNLVVRPWVKTGDYWGTLCDLTERIKLTFDKVGISIPYPQQDVHHYSVEKQAA